VSIPADDAGRSPTRLATFATTELQPCPYLDGREERRLFTVLQGPGADARHETLMQAGFRRSQNVVYRPVCPGCDACRSVRIPVARFAPSRNLKKILKRNADLALDIVEPVFSEEHFQLFRRYIEHRHADGGMADMDIFEFAAMVEETPIRSRVIEYEYAPEPDLSRGDLAAVCLTDILDDGLSLVYSFYDPHAQRRSLGTHVILDHVAMARDAGLPYVYLGYWVPGSPKMGYKAQFPALEIYKNGNWQDIGDPDSHTTEAHPLSVDPIAEQVARISLPDTLPTKG